MRKWIRQKLKSKSKGKEQTRDPLPFLPIQRPRELTPPSSSDGCAIPTQLPFHNFGLFGRLPYELRRKILVEAFGDRTLHVDLTYSRPLVRRSAASTESAAEQTRTLHCGLGSELAPDANQREGWQWFSCVCHRRAGYSETELEQRADTMKLSRTIEPCDDQCLEGMMCDCGQAGPACFVGVMGWLVVCRHAYIEGIDILYGTNTFHISSLDLLLNLPRLLPRHGLDRVASLELMWKLNVIRSKQIYIEDTIAPLWDCPSSQNSPLHTLCAMLPETFPHLRKLYISLQCWISPSFSTGLNSDGISEVETIVLGPIERMLRVLGPGPDKEFNVAIQRGGWYVLLMKYHHLLGTALRVESVDGLSRGRFWKSLAASDGDGGSQHGTSIVNAVRDGFGYWVCGGWEDMDGFTQDYWVVTNWGDKWTGGPKETF